MSTAVNRAAFEIVEEPRSEQILPDLQAIHAETRTKPVGIERFQWLYHQNPHGAAVVWTVRDQRTSEIAGFTACLPRRMWVNGTARVCWIGSDFSIRQRYRSLGLALKLRRAAKDQIDGGRVDFLYAHPNDRMAVIHEKVGHRRVGTMVRVARLLSSEAVFEERFGRGLAARAAAALVDPMLMLAGPEWRRRSRGTVEHHQRAHFNDEFDELFERTKGRYTIIGERTSSYLNWRYASNPLQDTQLLTFYAGRQLKGYLIFTVNEADRVGVIQDIFPADDVQVVQQLLSCITWAGRQAGWRSATITLLESNPLLGMLTAWQYRRRAETTQMFGYAPEGSELCTSITDHRCWFVTVGDRDV